MNWANRAGKWLRHNTAMILTAPVILGMYGLNGRLFERAK